MKNLTYLYLVLLPVVSLSGCVTIASPITQTSAPTQSPSSTAISPTVTPIFAPTETATLTLPVTLEPEQAKEALSILLQEPIDCLAPCFWGITPKQTTLDEARTILNHFGLQTKSTTFQGKDFHGIRYDFESSLSIIVTLTVQDYIVTDLRVDINPETQMPGVAREWSAYSPETLIARYDLPSKVDFFVGRAEPSPSYAIDIYFDTVDMIIQYYSYDIRANWQICPLTDQMDSIRIWMGKNPIYPPPSDLISLEQATSLTMEKFYESMTGDPKKACLTLKGEMFP
jgi:hypothetical protein